MKLVLLLLSIGAATAASNCPGVYINDKYYNVNLIKFGLNRVHELTFNRNDNTVYLTLEQIAKVPTRILAYVKFDESAGLIEGVRNATGLAIDHALNRLYVGGSDGLFMINLNNKDKVPEKLPVNHDIRSLFVKNNAVYFVNSQKEAYKFEFGTVTPVYELQGFSVDKLILDDDNNIFFLQNNSPYRVKMATRLVIPHENVTTHEKIYATDIAVDVNYKPYICTKNALYVYNKYKYVLDNVGNLGDIRKLAFVNADEPIYIIVDSLFKLTLNPVPCFGD